MTDIASASTQRSVGRGTDGRRLILIAAIVVLMVASSTLGLVVPAHLSLAPHAGASIPAAKPSSSLSARSTAPGVRANVPVAPAPLASGASTPFGSPFSFPPNFHIPTLNHAGAGAGSAMGGIAPRGMISPSSPGLAGSGWGGGGSGYSIPKFCDGIWPSTLGQGGYAGGTACYGHDEPGLDFYSPINGSGGNVTWNITLPTDRSPTQNQSDLYSAIWFGMVLTDPFAWMDACFLELQFYPDSGWYAPGPSDPNATVPGLWVGQAVAWQIEAATGAENPCFISPLFAHGTYGPDMFNMTQGDRISISMTGWTNNPNGENITVNDLTNGNNSYIDLYNHTGNYGSYNLPSNNYILGHPNYPLNPSYSRNAMENGLPWTPGGELPVAFAFEIGHGGNPTVPNTNPYGGCSPGVPPSNPSSPCPSYDPGSWTNDTATPWQIDPPTFFNATSRMTPAQVGFHQDIGGPGFINNATGNAVTTACIGHLPSAWCDYPWFSYSCTEHTFNYGATDYANTIDFGQDNQYNLVQATSSAGLNFYTPNNVSVPSCGGPTYGVTVGGSGGGSAYFLNQSETAPTLFAGITPGYYSIHGYAVPGKDFVNWSTSGPVTVGNRGDPFTSLHVTGAGTVTANFAASAPTTSVTFMSNPSGGSIDLTPSYFFTTALGSDELSGAIVPLNGGIYSILALPPAGYNFTGWSVSGTSARVTSPTLPYTMLVVNAGGSSATLTANFRTTTFMVEVCVAAYSGSGSVTIPGHASFGNCAFANGAMGPGYTLPLGGYAVTAVASAGWGFAGWAYSSSIILNDGVNPSGHFVAEQYAAGFAVAVVAYFAPAVKLDAAPVNGGAISVGPSGAPGFATVPSGTTFYLFPGTYTIAAAPVGGRAFSSWTSSSGANLWVESPSSAVSQLVVNFTGTLTANFVSAVAHDTVWFNDTPTGSGQLFFNYQLYPNGASNSSVASGVFTVFVLVPLGYTLSGVTVSGDISPLGLGTVSVTHLLGVGWINATFTPAPIPVTYVGPGSATISTAVVTSDNSVALVPGNYVLSANLPTNTTFNGWRSQGEVHVASPTSASTSVTVWGPGVVWASETGTAFTIGSITLAPGPVVQELSAFRANVSALSGPGPFSYLWSAPTGWCPTLITAAITCTPTSVGNVTLKVQVHDAFGDLLSPTPVKVQVVQPFAIQSLYVSVHNLTLGTNLVLSVSWVGGTGPYSVDFTGVPGCVLVTTSTETCTPSTVGSFTLNATGTDGTGQMASAFAAIVVNPALVIQSFTASPSTFTVGVIVGIATAVQGGTLPYTYAYHGLPSGPGCTSANNSSLTCLPTLAGTYNLTVHVTDHGGGSANLTARIVVNVVPAISSFAASPTSVSSGSTVTLTVASTGGTAPYTYLYSGLPSDCASQNASTLTCASTMGGTYTVTVKVTDADGKSASQSTSFTVSGGGSSGAPAGGLTTFEWLGIAVVVAVALALIALLLLRRRPSAPTSAAPPPAAVAAPVNEPPPPPAPGAGGESYIYGEDSGPR